MSQATIVRAFIVLAGLIFSQPLMAHIADDAVAYDGDKYNAETQQGNKTPCTDKTKNCVIEDHGSWAEIHSYPYTGTGLALINQPAVAAAGHKGAGSAVVLHEPQIPPLNLTNELGDLLFGDCRRPVGAKDYEGWAPESGADNPCMIAWVQCLRSSEQALRVCDAPVATHDRKAAASQRLYIGHHPDRVTRIIRDVAPAAKLIFLVPGTTSNEDLQTEVGTYKGMQEWLLRDASAYGPGGSFGSGRFSTHDDRRGQTQSAETVDISAWRAHWNLSFCNADACQSPAEFFNVVATYNWRLANLHFGPGDRVEGGKNGHEYHYRALDSCGFNPEVETPDGLRPDPTPAGKDVFSYIDDWAVWARVARWNPDAEPPALEMVANNVCTDDLYDFSDAIAACEVQVRAQARMLDFSGVFSRYLEANIASLWVANNGIQMNSLKIPACFEDSLVISSVYDDYGQPGSDGALTDNQHPTRLAFVAPASSTVDPAKGTRPVPTSGSSFSTAYAVGALAVLRAPDVAGDLSLKQTLQIIRATSTTRVPETRECFVLPNPDDSEQIAILNAHYCPEEGLWREKGSLVPVYTQRLIDLDAAVRRSLSFNADASVLQINSRTLIDSKN